MVTFRSMVIFMVLAAFLSMGVACSSNEPPSQLTEASNESAPEVSAKEDQPAAAPQAAQPETAPEVAAQQEPPADTAKTLALTGTVEKAGDDVVLITNMGDYVISGQDFSDLVGKTIDVTGAVQESNGRYTIDVISFTEHVKE